MFYSEEEERTGRGVAEFLVGMVAGTRGDSYLRASPLSVTLEARFSWQWRGVVRLNEGCT